MIMYVELPVSDRLRRRIDSLLGYDLRSATASHALAPPRGRLDV